MESLVKIPTIEFKSTLKSHVFYETLLLKVTEELKKIPNTSGFKLNNEYTALVSTIVENAVKKEDKVDKKKLVLAILQSVFALTPPELVTVATQIEYLLENKLIVTEVKPMVVKVYHKLLKCISSKK